MAGPEREDAATRRAKLAEAITAHRRAGSQSAVYFGAETDDESPVVEYVDREITVEVGDAERDRLDALLADFHVFKIAQPATRKAPAGEIHISALADPKHTADFVDRLFLDVYDFEESYALAIVEP
ncbi:hypothetical protein ACFR9U_01265 [Halorientalis brevis]|uniref:DUF7975 domain-containing protein n=1 Tax=Halorientalis brevis TaxID=1126241 RepID=A0ABD6C850_9EURY|nr:hypothetical protein [Halorientalis brevis]